MLSLHMLNYTVRLSSFAVTKSTNSLYKFIWNIETNIGLIYNIYLAHRSIYMFRSKRADFEIASRTGQM